MTRTIHDASRVTVASLSENAEMGGRASRVGEIRRVALSSGLLPLALICVVMSVGCQQEKQIAVKMKKSKADQSQADSADFLSEGKSIHGMVAVSERLASAKTQTLAPGVHALGKLGVGCVYAIETGKGLILIDAGEEEFNFSLRESLLEVGLKLEDVKYVLLTHLHFDQVLGVNEIRRASGAIVAAGAADAQALAKPDLDAIWSVFEKVPYSGVAIEVDRQLSDGDKIELGDVSVEAMAMPGHTPGSMCYLIEKEGQRILASGDVIASLNHGPAIYPARISPRYGGDPTLFLDSLSRLLEMQPPDLLLPGHPSQHSRPLSVRLDETAWQGLLEPAREELQKIVDRREQDGADFLDEQPKELEPGLYLLGTRDSVAVYCVKQNDEWLLVNAPGGAGLNDFLKERLAQLGANWSQPTTVILTSDDNSRRTGLGELGGDFTVFAADASMRPLRGQGYNVLPWVDLQQQVPVIKHLLDLPYGFACALEWNGKRVLVTDSVPRFISLRLTGKRSGGVESATLQGRYPELWNEVGNDRSELEPFVVSLDALQSQDPQIWLPARPWDGQNANLYESMWQDLLKSNGGPAETILLRMAP